jgi:hypothetical protein
MGAFPRPSPLEWLCLVGGLFLTIHYAWILDDAYVYFRYIDNLLFLKSGLVYNRGEYVEGFSSPLWLLLLSLLRTTRLNFWILVRVAGILGFFAFWMLLVVVNRRLSPRNSPVFNLPLLYLSFNYGVLCYFTSGTEGPIVQVLAVAFALFVLLPNFTPVQVLVAIAPLARHELIVPFVIGVAWLWIRERRPPWRMILLGCLFSGSWLLFRIYYYADLVPVTFYLKNIVDVGQGLLYLTDTLRPYHFYPIALLVAAMLVVMKLLKKPVALSVPERIMMVTMAIAVTLYVVKVGGDGRHYRYLAFPFCLAVCSFAGVVETALEAWRPKQRRAVMLMAGLALAAFSFSLYPRQVDRHPVLMKDGQRMINNIADAHHHRFHARLPKLSPWARGTEIELLPRYTETAVPPYGPYETSRVDYICWVLYKAFSSRAIHNLGLTEPFLARTEMPSDRPGHKKGLKPLGGDIAKVYYWWGAKDPQPGIFRKAVEAGVAPQWMADNLPTLELVELKIYNQHHFFENLRLAFTFHDPVRLSEEQ